MNTRLWYQLQIFPLTLFAILASPVSATVPAPPATATPYSELALLDIQSSILDSCIVFRDAVGNISVDETGSEQVFRVSFNASESITNFRVVSYTQLTATEIDDMRSADESSLLLSCSGEYRDGIYRDTVYLDAPGNALDGQVFYIQLILNDSPDAVFTLDETRVEGIRSYLGNTVALGDDLGDFAFDSSLTTDDVKTVSLRLPECVDPQADPVSVDLLLGNQLFKQNLQPGSRYSLGAEQFPAGMYKINARCQDDPQFDSTYRARVTATGGLLLVVLAHTSGIDRIVSVVLNGTADDEILTGDIKDDTLRGGDGNDTLHGLAGNDTLDGDAGNDTHDGGPGADIMTGGTGDDIYLVDDVGDSVIENTGEGSDEIQTEISLSLPANVENLTLLGSASLSGTGNSLNNTIVGNSGNNALDGGAGEDNLQGGAGDDDYTVDNVNDTVIEAAAAGNDTVIASVSYTITDVDVENLTLSGSGNIDATGNSADNVLIGNSGDNNLGGLAGADTIYGGNGADSLDGGAGADSLYGNDGDDIFIADDTDLKIDGGNDSDTLRVLADFTASIAQQVENIESINLESAGLSLYLGASISVTATINGFATGSSTITGSAGDETIIGGTQSDTLAGTGGNDVINAGASADTVDASGAVVQIVQASGDSVARTAETVTVHNIANAETMTFGSGVDVIAGFTSGADKLDVATANNYIAFGNGSDASNLTANNNYSVRGDWNSGSGVFTLNFGGGADLLVVTNAANADLDSAAQTSIVILTGVTSLAAGDFN